MENQSHRPPTSLPSTPPAAADRTLASRREESPASEPTGQASGSPGDPPSVKASARPKQPKTILGGDFQLLRKLGAGAMGAVYQARQLSVGRHVALKVLFKHVAANRTLLKRFRREARIMAQLHHPNIVSCYGMGQEQGRPFLIMEYVDGRSLRDWLMRLGRFRVGDALHLVLACAQALQHAHEHGLVHRDIKPDNVLLTQTGVVKLTDLGLAKAMLEDLSVTQTGHGAGTPVYMAPEQARNAKYVDQRSDIYALGCMFYQLLSGQLPFRGATVLEVILAKMKGKYTPVRELNPEVPAGLERMLAKMLARLPEERYQSCGDLIGDLKSLGLDHAALSFLSVATSSPAGHSVPLAPTVAAWQLSDSAGVSSPTPLTETATDWWYVVYRTREGKWVTRKLTIEQMRQCLQDEHFCRTAQASNSSQGDYRSLGSYPEFEAVLRARQRRAKTKRKTAQFVARCQRVAEEEKRQQRWAALRRLRHTPAGRLLVGATAVLLGAGLVLLLLHLFGKGW